eukprot:2618399-Rhodomonas_salina.3
MRHACAGPRGRNLLPSLPAMLIPHNMGRAGVNAVLATAVVCCMQSGVAAFSLGGNSPLLWQAKKALFSPPAGMGNSFVGKRIDFASQDRRVQSAASSHALGRCGKKSVLNLRASVVCRVKSGRACFDRAAAAFLLAERLSHSNVCRTSRNGKATPI